MGVTSTSFKPGNKASVGHGRPALTPEQREARALRAQMQPAVVRELFRIALEADETKDRIAALKSLLEEMPVEFRDVTEGSNIRPLRDLIAAGLGALALAGENPSE